MCQLIATLFAAPGFATGVVFGECIEAIAAVNSRIPAQVRYVCVGGTGCASGDEYL